MRQLAIYHEKLKGASFVVIWQPNGKGAHCAQWIKGARVTLSGDRINLSSIAHEIHHAVDWLAACEIFNGREEEACAIGALVEHTVAGFLANGWVWGAKADGVWLVGKDVSLVSFKAAERSGLK